MYEESEENLYALLHTVSGITTENEQIIDQFIKKGFV